MFSHMQEALTIAAWMAVGVFVLAACADGRGYRVLRGVLAALAWIIDKVRELKARRQDRTTAEGHADPAPSSSPTRLSSARSARAATARTASGTTKARDTPTRSQATG